MKPYYTIALCSLLLFNGMDAFSQTPTLVADINPGKVPSDPLAFVPFNGKLIFVALDNAHGRELWSYSGTGAPTLVYDLNPAAAYGVGTSFRPAAVLGSKLYFIGSNGSGTAGGTTAGELFMYDGTNPPSLAADVEPGLMASSPKRLTTMGDKLYFGASTSAAGNEMFSYDGVNPPVLHDIVPGKGGSFADLFIPYNGKLYFAALINGMGQEPCVYDPATDSVSIVADIDAGPGSSYPSGFIVAAGKLWFGARTASNGSELFSYDGSNLVRVPDLAAGGGSGVLSTGLGGNTVELASLNGHIYLAGTEDGASTQLYRHDPATGITSLVMMINTAGTSGVKSLTEYKGRLYFRATNGTTGYELWSTDGTTTDLVADINPGSGHSNPMHLFVWNGVLYMRADNGINGNELYRLHDATGVSAAGFGGRVQLSPNPARDVARLELTLPASETLSAGLFDESGRLLWAKADVRCPVGQSVLELPVKDLAPGIYFYRLTGRDGQVLSAGRVQRQ